MKKVFFITILFLKLNIFANEHVVYGSNPDLPTVAIFTTGGTISEKKDPKTGLLVPADIINFIKTIPNITDIAHLKIIQFSNIDSSQMTPNIWFELSQSVDKVLKDRKIAGAVIVHGTDTMSEGAFFLDITLKTDKPVVFTGAMRAASDPYPDGPFNVYNAVCQVCSKNALNWGVTVTLNQYINSARDVEKINTTNPQAFTSGEKGYLGYIFNNKVFRINNRLYRQKFSLSKNLPKVDLYTDYSGARPEILRYIVDSGAEGIVIESLGSGNVNAELYDVIQYAIKKGVIIVITSIVPQGGVFPIYGTKGGGQTLEKLGVIFSNFVRGDKARILLMIAMSNVGKDIEKLSDIFKNP
ncbi:MAG: asparaginase [Parachlamydiales bacterium]|nr:asparaginase [Parachlamydiales bacterium]